MRKPKNLPRHELIGLKVKVVKSKNQDEERIHGRVIDETKSTLDIESEDGVKRIRKEGRTFKFDLPSREEVKVKGRVLEGRPEDRIKKKLRKW